MEGGRSDYRYFLIHIYVVMIVMIVFVLKKNKELKTDLMANG